MVECSELFLGPWLAADRSIGRTVFNTKSDPVGSIHQFTPGWRWGSRSRFEIREGDDHSLLFSVSPRCWPRRWLVQDADQELVGSLIRRSGQRSIEALGRTGSPLGGLRWLSAKSLAQGVSPRGGWLCEVSRTTSGTRIAFAAETDPFSRMVFLAAGLVLGL